MCPYLEEDIAGQSLFSYPSAHPLWMAGTYSKVGLGLPRTESTVSYITGTLQLAVSHEKQYETNYIMLPRV